MGDLNRAFRYPLTGEGWGSKVAFGGVLCVLGTALGFIPWAGWVLWLLIAFLPMGYAYKLFREHLRGSDVPLPGWEEWGDLFQQGFSVFLVSLGYWIVPALLYGLGMMLWDRGGFAAFWGVLFVILGVGIGLVAFFLLPMALAFYAREGSSWATAFGWSGIVEKIWLVQKDYFVGWLAALCAFLILFIVKAYFLYLGWVLYSLGIFYLSLVTAHLFGRLCRASLEVK